MQYGVNPTLTAYTLYTGIDRGWSNFLNLWQFFLGTFIHKNLHTCIYCKMSKNVPNSKLQILAFAFKYVSK